MKQYIINEEEIEHIAIRNLTLTEIKKIKTPIKLIANGIGYYDDFHKIFDISCGKRCVFRRTKASKYAKFNGKYIDIYIQEDK